MYRSELKKKKGNKLNDSTPG